MSDATILVVDDDKVLLNAIRLTLESDGHRVLTAQSGQEALQLLEGNAVSLILADIAMPGMNGYQLLHRVREVPEWIPIPFVFLSARSMDSDVRFGKELGVDDYLIKPMQPSDLLASVRGKLLRSSQWRQAATGYRTRNVSVSGLDTVQVGRLRIDRAQHRVWYSDELVSLSAREFRLLDCLASSAGNVVGTEELIAATHGLDSDAEDAGSLIRPLVRSVRRKLGFPPGETGFIENVRGVGYRLLLP
jgi:DNA-binding response OmpR family regulator